MMQSLRQKKLALMGDVYKSIALLLARVVKGSNVTLLVLLEEKGLMDSLMFTTESPKDVKLTLQRMLSAWEEQSDERSRIIVPESL